MPLKCVSGVKGLNVQSYYREHQIVYISVHRPLATLVRAAEITKEWEFFCLSAEMAERQKKHPFGRWNIEYGLS
jgi:hypothetical protein